MDNTQNKSYKKRGYNEFFERSGQEKKIPFLSGYDVDSYIEEISATKITSGIIKSKDGKLVINVDAGTIEYEGTSII